MHVCREIRLGDSPGKNVTLLVLIPSVNLQKVPAVVNCSLSLLVRLYAPVMGLGIQ